MKETKRYSEQDLKEFKVLIEQKLERAKREWNYYKEQIEDVEERISDEHDGYTEDAMIMSDLELLNGFAYRQKKFIHQLEAALIRVHNKSYGICELTGELIDKRRLLVAPVTTKSLLAKSMPVELPKVVTKPIAVAKKTATPKVKTTKTNTTFEWDIDENIEENIEDLAWDEDGISNHVPIEEVEDEYGYEADFA